MNIITSRKYISAIWISAFAYLIVSMGMGATAHAQAVDMDFDSLPSDVGWIYISNQLAEGDVFVANGSSLVQTTVGAGNDADAGYEQDGIVNSGDEMSLSFTVRILAYEKLTDGSTGLGFNFLIRDEAADYRLAMTDTAVIVNGQVLSLDTTAFHDYVFELHPDGTFDLFVDGALSLSGAKSMNPGQNRFFFGDSTAHENTDAEITAFSFAWVGRDAPDIEVQKTVNNSFPMANEPVEFTVQVNNIGGTQTADVLIIDQLPAEMIIPAGTAAFASVGSYDPVTGEWTVGNMNPGDTAVLTVPAVVTEAEPPACIVNTARSEFSDIFDDDNDVAHAAIHRAGIERCVDVLGAPDIGAGVSFLVQCDSQRRYEGSVILRNAGPDDARNVTVSLSQTPIVGASIRFNDNACQQSGTNVCVVASIASGETLSLSATSDLFRNYKEATQSVAVSVTTTDTDYNPANDLITATGAVNDFSNCDPIGDDFGLGNISIGPACFIATAAYGSSMHPHLDRLRNFRDRFMLTNRPGRSLVGLYYRYSPPMADYIAERDWLRGIVRGLLAPIVYTIIYPGQAALLLIGLIALVIVRRRRRNRLQV